MTQFLLTYHKFDHTDPDHIDRKTFSLTPKMEGLLLSASGDDDSQNDPGAIRISIQSDEVVIELQMPCRASLHRGDRSCILKLGHAVRLLPKDAVCIASTVYIVDGLTKQSEPSTSSALNTVVGQTNQAADVRCFDSTVDSSEDVLWFDTVEVSSMRGRFPADREPSYQTLLPKEYLPKNRHRSRWFCSFKTWLRKLFDK